MPEGDSIRRLADRLHGATAGRRVRRSDLRVPRRATVDLRGAEILGVDAYGKHLLHRFRTPAGEDLTLHTHLRMDGSWTVLRPGRRLPRHLADQVRVVLELDDGTTAVGVALPVVDLLPTDEEDSVLGHLGPDILADGFDPQAAAARIAQQPERPAVEALLDQRNVAGIGNLWAVETLYLRGVSPWASVGTVDLPPLLTLARRMMRYALRHPGQVTTGDTRRGRTHWVYGRAGRPCHRCGTTVRMRPATGLPYERETWWCPACQPGSGPPPRPDRPPAQAAGTGTGSPPSDREPAGRRSRSGRATGPAATRDRGRAAGPATTGAGSARARG